MNPTSVGFAVGLMVAVVLLIFIFKYANRGKVRTQYDERQKTVRGKAYRYAFYTEIFAQAVLMMLFMSDIELPIENYALVFIAVIAGCLVLATYCIWNDVYWGLNNDHKRYYIVFAIAGVFNVLPVFFNALSGTLIENGKIGMPLLNIVVLVMMAVVTVELIIKGIMDKKAVVEE